MNTDTIWHISTVSSDQTEMLAEQIGRSLRGGEILELSSDLGGGKTTFVRGLARGIESGDHVASPTFTVSREYHGNNLTLYHFDFYRLSEGGMVAAELQDYLGDPKAVVVIEWADIIKDGLPTDYISVKIAVTGDTMRDITIHLPATHTYLTPGLQAAGAHQ